MHILQMPPVDQAIAIKRALLKHVEAHEELKSLLIAYAPGYSPLVETAETFAHQTLRDLARRIGEDAIELAMLPPPRTRAEDSRALTIEEGEAFATRAASEIDPESAKKIDTLMNDVEEEPREKKVRWQRERDARIERQALARRHRDEGEAES